MPFHLFSHKFEEFQINYAPKTLQKRVRALEQEKKTIGREWRESPAQTHVGTGGLTSRIIIYVKCERFL